MEGKIKDIINGLLKEEEAENLLISLYIYLLELGVENCLPEAERENFRKNLGILYSESISHKEIILSIFKKYKSL